MRGLDTGFHMEVREHPEAVLVDLVGDLSRNAQEPSSVFLRDWEEKRSRGSGFMVLNFTGVPYINSLGIALLIRLVRTTAKAGNQTFAYGITPHYQKLFLMVGLTEYMMVYPDEYSILQRIEALASS